MSFPIAVIIMLIAGLTGGTVNYLLPSNFDILKNEKIRNWFNCVALGIGATILIPLFLEIAQSKLLDDIHLGYEWQRPVAAATKKDSIQSITVRIGQPDSPLVNSSDSPAQKIQAVVSGGKDETIKKEVPPLKNYLLYAAYCFLAAAAGVRFINGLIDSVLKDRQIANLKDENADEKKAKDEAETKKKKAEAEKLKAEKEKEKLDLQNKVNLMEAEQHIAEKVRPKTRSMAAIPTIGKITDDHDPQKNRFGGKREVGNKRLEATVEESFIPMFYDVKIWMETTDGSDLEGEVIFYLHDSFAEPVRVVTEFPGNKATVEVKAYGAFTVGAVCDGGRTLLEYDLSEDKRFPEEFRER